MPDESEEPKRRSARFFLVLRRPTTVVLAVFGVLPMTLSGCLLAPDDAGGAHVPAGPHRPWTHTSAGPWIARTGGCGFCSGNPDVPEADSTVVYDSGDVLWFRFGRGSNQGTEDVSVVPGLEAYEAELQRVVAEMDNWHVENRSVRVHEVASSRLVAEEWSLIRAKLADAAERAQDPGPPRYDCQDCGAAHVELLGERKLKAELYGNYETGDSWGRLLGQMDAIRDWVQAWKEP